MTDLQELLALARPEVLQLQAYSAARTEGDQSAIRIFLDANENPYPPYPADDRVLDYNRYPEVQSPALRQAFADLYGVPIESLFLSRGADEAIDLLTRVFCAEGRDAVVVNPPTFPMYEHSARVQGARLVEVPLLPHNFQLDVPALEAVAAAERNIKLIMVASPNNPTARLLRREDLLSVARTFRGRAILVVDELYIDYSDAESLAGAIPEHPNIVILRSLSKEYSLAGERIGATIAHPTIIGLLNRVSAPYSLTRSSIRAALDVLSIDGRAHSQRNIERIVADREELSKSLDALWPVVEVFPSDANFLLVRFIDAKATTAALTGAGIRVRDRSNVPGLDGCIRISIGTEAENAALLRVVEGQEAL